MMMCVLRMYWSETVRDGADALEDVEEDYDDDVEQTASVLEKLEPG